MSEIRKEKGLTQDDVAKAANISRAAYTNIENGKRSPSPRIAKRLGQILGFDWPMLYSGDLSDEKSRNSA